MNQAIMTNTYLSTPLMWNHSIEEIFRTAKEQRMGLEIFHQQMDYHGVAIEELQRLIAAYELEVFVHAYSWDLNLCALQESVRAVSVLETKKSIAFAHALGAKDVTIHPGRLSIGLEESVHDGYMHASMKELMADADERNQPISFEIMEPVGKEFITDRHVLERVAGDLWERMYVTLDVAHCRDEEMVLDHLNKLPRIRKLHLSNRTERQYHTPLGEGALDFGKLSPDILASGLPIVIEGMDLGLERKVLKKNITYLKEEFFDEME